VIGTRWNPTTVCGRGAVDPSHPRPVMISQEKLIPAIRAEVSHLRLPESVELERAADDGRLVALALKRERVMDSYMDGVIGKADRDRRLAQIDQDVAKVGARTVVVSIPPIDWSSPQNTILRAIFHRIELGPDLMPVRFNWAVPEWRVGQP